MACLGPLTAGTTYTTTVMQPTLTYSVPVEGWMNYEDTPGNFLLVPPDNDLAGVNGGTADFIGVYTSIAASRFDALPTCSISRVPGVDNTPEAIAAWIGHQKPLLVTKPRKVSTGGLSGLVIDIRAKPGAKPPVCKEGDATVKVFLLFSGLPPSSLAHGVIADMTMRLYLLDHDGGTLAIEITDIDAAPATLRAMTKVAEDITFEET